MVCRYGITTTGCVITQKSEVLVWCKVSNNEAREVRTAVSDMQRTQESGLQTYVLKFCTYLIEMSVFFKVSLRETSMQKY